MVSDSAAGDGGVEGTWQPSAEAAAYFAQIKRLRKGESADLDGDGKDELEQSKDSEGRVILLEDKNEDGAPEYYRSYDPSTGQFDVLMDWNSDGFAETMLVRKKGSVVTDWDTDDDGAYDKRQTDTYDYAKGVIVTKVEKDNGSGLEPLYEYQSPIRKAECGQKKPGPSTPSTDPPRCNSKYPPKGTYCAGDGSDVCIANNGTGVDGADGSCSKPHAERLAKALSCAANRSNGCLSNSNDDFAHRMTEAMTNGTLEVSCGTAKNPAQDKSCNEQGSNANADAPTDRGGPHGGLSMNGENMDKIGDDELCSVVLHEMLHWADAPDEGDTHGDGVDKVYACGRYCGGSGGCQMTKSNTPNDGTNWSCGISGPSWDCARCAGTKDEKAKCGSKTKIQAGGEAPGGICHGGLGCLMGSCESANTKVQTSCDNEEMGSTFLCCASCSSGCTDSNDFPCTQMPKPEDTCKTPECK